MPVWVKFEDEPEGTYVVKNLEWKGPSEGFVRMLNQMTEQWVPGPGDTNKPDRWIAEKAAEQFGGKVVKDTEKPISKPGRIY